MDVIQILYNEVENNTERKDEICLEVCNSGSFLVNKASKYPHLPMSKMLLLSFKLCVLFFQHIEFLKGCHLNYSAINMDEFCIKIQNDLFGKKVIKTREDATEYFHSLISHFNL